MLYPASIRSVTTSPSTNMPLISFIACISTFYLNTKLIFLVFNSKTSVHQYNFTIIMVHKKIKSKTIFTNWLFFTRLWIIVWCQQKCTSIMPATNTNCYVNIHTSTITVYCSHNAPLDFQKNVFCRLRFLSINLYSMYFTRYSCDLFEWNLLWNVFVTLTVLTSL